MNTIDGRSHGKPEKKQSNAERVGQLMDLHEHGVEVITEKDVQDQKRKISNRIEFSYASQLEKKEVLPEKHLLSLYLNELLKKRLGINEGKVEVYRSEEKNAFTVGEHHIFVSTGMLSFLRFEEEILSVLAHEYIHSKQEHIEQMNNDHIKTQKHHERFHEIQADIEGMMLLDSKGVNPYGAISAMLRFEKLTPGLKGWDLSHGSSTDRRVQLMGLTRFHHFKHIRFLGLTPFPQEVLKAVRTLHNEKSTAYQVPAAQFISASKLPEALSHKPIVTMHRLGAMCIKNSEIEFQGPENKQFRVNHYTKLFEEALRIEFGTEAYESLRPFLLKLCAPSRFSDEQIIAYCEERLSLHIESKEQIEKLFEHIQRVACERKFFWGKGLHDPTEAELQIITWVIATLVDSEVFTSDEAITLVVNTINAASLHNDLSKEMIAPLVELEKVIDIDPEEYEEFFTTQLPQTLSSVKNFINKVLELGFEEDDSCLSFVDELREKIKKTVADDERIKGIVLSEKEQQKHDEKIRTFIEKFKSVNDSFLYSSVETADTVVKELDKIAFIHIRDADLYEEFMDVAEELLNACQNDMQSGPYEIEDRNTIYRHVKIVHHLFPDKFIDKVESLFLEGVVLAHPDLLQKYVREIKDSHPELFKSKVFQRWIDLSTMYCCVKFFEKHNPQGAVDLLIFMGKNKCFQGIGETYIHSEMNSYMENEKGYESDGLSQFRTFNFVKLFHEHIPEMIDAASTLEDPMDIKHVQYVFLQSLENLTTKRDAQIYLDKQLLQKMSFEEGLEFVFPEGEAALFELIPELTATGSHTKAQLSQLSKKVQESFATLGNHKEFHMGFLLESFFTQRDPEQLFFMFMDTKEHPEALVLDLLKPIIEHSEIVEAISDGKMSVPKVLDELYSVNETGRRFILERLLLGPHCLLDDSNFRERLKQRLFSKLSTYETSYSIYPLELALSKAIETLPSIDLYFLLEPVLLENFLERPTDYDRDVLFFSMLEYKLELERAADVEEIEQRINAYVREGDRLEYADSKIYEYMSQGIVHELLPSTISKVCSQYSWPKNKSLDELAVFLDFYIDAVEQNGWHEAYEYKAEILHLILEKHFPENVMNVKSNDRKIVEFLGVEIEEKKNVETFEELLLSVLTRSGALGIRAAQIIGQYVELNPELRAVLSSVYDNNEGQSKLTAFHTLENTEFMYQDYVIGEKLGGGSLVTVFELHGKDIGEEVVKVLSPSYDFSYNRMAYLIARVVYDLAQCAESNKVFDYGPTRQMFDDIHNWVKEDVKNTGFIEKNKRYAQRWNGEKMFKKSAYSLVVPEMKGTESREWKVESKYQGIPLTNIEALQERGDNVKDIVQSIALHYVHQVLEGFMHTDIHPGNFLVTDEKEIVVLDRNYVIELSAEDMKSAQSLLKGVSQGISTPKEFMKILQGSFDLTQRQSDAILAKAQRLLEDIQAGEISKERALPQFIAIVREEGVILPLWMTLLIKNVNGAVDLMKQADLSMADFARELKISVFKGKLAKLFKK